MNILEKLGKQIKILGKIKNPFGRYRTIGYQKKVTFKFFN